MNSQNDPQDHNNLLFAIILSLAVLMGWQYFIAAPKMREEQARREFSKEQEAQRTGGQPQGVPGVATPPVSNPTTAAPPLAGQPAQAPVSREESLKTSPRLAIRTPSLEGSFALKG